MFVINTENFSTGELVTTVSASDNDNPTTLNGIFEFALVSVTPKTDNVEFYITQSNTTGNIYFKGCLDYEVKTTQCSVICSVLLLSYSGYKMSTHTCFFLWEKKKHNKNGTKINHVGSFFPLYNVM